MAERELESLAMLSSDSAMTAAHSRPVALYIFASFFGVLGGLFLWGEVLLGSMVAGIIPWILRALGWQDPLPKEIPWPRAMIPTAWLAMVVSSVWLVAAHYALDHPEPATGLARGALVTALVIGTAGLGLVLWWSRHVQPWWALAVAGVAVLLASGPVYFFVSTYADNLEWLYLLLGLLGAGSLGVHVWILSKLGGPVRTRRLLLGIPAGCLISVVVASALLLLDLKGQAARAQLAHEEAPVASFVMLVVLLLILAARWRPSLHLRTDDGESGRGK